MKASEKNLGRLIIDFQIPQNQIDSVGGSLCLPLSFWKTKVQVSCVIRGYLQYTVLQHSCTSCLWGAYVFDGSVSEKTSILMWHSAYDYGIACGRGTSSQDINGWFFAGLGSVTSPVLAGHAINDFHVAMGTSILWLCVFLIARLTELIQADRSSGRADRVSEYRVVLILYASCSTDTVCIV